MPLPPSGAIARARWQIMFALSLPAVMAVVGVTADFAIYNMKHSRMQSAVDQAAIAAAKELTLSNANANSIQSAADGAARSFLNDLGAEVTVESEVDKSGKQVQVKMSETWTPFFAHFFGANVTPIKVDATAGLFGQSKICVLALTTTEIGAVSMTKNSHLKADDCTVYTNSNNSSSMYLGDTSSLDAKLVCTVGGVKDNGSLSADKVVTDCPVLNDPLASRVAPTIGICKATNLSINSGTVTLDAGTYCGGLRVSGSAVVNLNPGIYVMKGGPLLVYDKASLLGSDVGFFMTGALGLVHLLGDATIDLNGRETGPMAGMLFFDDPKEKGILRIHSVSATNARNLTGTIYLPNGNLIVDPTATVGAESAYTAIVAKRLVVQNGPTLVLNTNYNDTPVPVPDGIRAAADIHLVD